MKQKILIGVLILLIVIVAGIWTYMFFSPSGNGGVFTNFGKKYEKEQRTDTSDQQSVVDTAPATQSGEPQPLRQLTTRPAAAATFIDDGIRYVERGTGYVYDIMFKNGNETQVTNTTVPRVVEAVFSESGSRVAMASEEGGEKKAVVGTITRNDAGEGVVDGSALPDGAHSLNFTDSGETLRFAVPATDGTIGYAYNIPEQTQTRLFSIPLTQVEIMWGEDATYVYTTPSAKQFGYLYEINGNRLSYVTAKEPGLTAKRVGKTILMSTPRDDAIETFVLDGARRDEAPLRLFLEKCVDTFHATSSLYCAAPEIIPPGTYPDDWYKGLISFSDSLWEYRLNGSVTEVADLLEMSGREIDIAAIYQDPEGDHLAFINKNDDSLWLYALDVD